MTTKNMPANERVVRDGYAVAELLEVYEQPVLIEEFLPGLEFTCGVLGNGREARVLPLVAMRFDALPEGALPIYGFEAKWIWDTPDQPLKIFECPAQIGDDMRSAIEAITLRAYAALGCRDWSRIDVRLDAAGAPHVPASAEDWGREFLSLVAAVKIVGSLDEALAHIRKHGSGHSEAIVTEDPVAASRFKREVDAAAVFVNASTQFTDGGEFGLGAEVGISTQKLHARGPMGLREMTTYKWVIEGSGQIRS